MQEQMLTAAADAGVEVWRGSRVTSVTGGSPVKIDFDNGTRIHGVTARLAVGADGGDR
jgi:2-polyprenyl-6-methoxyphenol hydroxylase-like FAD-dependent oxidoreductase